MLSIEFSFHLGIVQFQNFCLVIFMISVFPSDFSDYLYIVLLVSLNIFLHFYFIFVAHYAFLKQLF